MKGKMNRSIKSGFYCGFKKLTKNHVSRVYLCKTGNVAIPMYNTIANTHTHVHIYIHTSEHIPSNAAIACRSQTRNAALSDFM